MTSSALKNRWIWITGASSGIGEGLTRQLIAQGNRIIVTARNSDKLQSLQALAPDQVWTLQADISLAESTAHLKTKLAEITPFLDTVILNAGNCEYIDVEDFEADLVRRVTEVNFFGLSRCIEACLPLLRQSEQRPHLVGISSASVFFGLPRAEAYGASKAAVSHLLESLRIDLYRSDIDVTIVYPGFVDTPLTRKNDFPMPWLMDNSTAVDKILSGISKRKYQIAFPAPLIWSLKFLNWLPTKWSIRIAQKMTKAAQTAA